MLKILNIYETFTIDVYCNVEKHGINQSYHVILKLENQQTMVIGAKFIKY